MSIFDAGVEFVDANMGPVLMKKWGDQVWLFTKHPDGQWVSHRECTKDDYKKISSILQEQHGSVLRAG